MRRSGGLDTSGGQRYQAQTGVSCPPNAHAISATECECNPGSLPTSYVPLACSPNAVGAMPNSAGVAVGDVASAAFTVTQMLIISAAGAALGALIASQQKAPQPTGRNAVIGAVALPILAVL